MGFLRYAISSVMFVLGVIIGFCVVAFEDPAVAGYGWFARGWVRLGMVFVGAINVAILWGGGWAVAKYKKDEAQS